MSELPDVTNLLDAAETAANSGDLASANDLLHRVARIQEAELGPLHPDLANTLNNLAIVAETTGRLSDAERFYRRAVAVASASRPADDPQVVSSRRNLEAFCRDHGVSIDAPAAAAPVSDLPEGGSHGDEDAATPPEVQRVAPALPSVTSLPAPRPAAAVSSRSPSAPVRMSRTLATVEIAVAVLVVVTLVVLRPWSARNAPGPVSTAVPAPTQTTEPPPAQQAQVPAPSEQTKPSKTGSPRNSNADVTTKPGAGARAAGGMTLVTSQLCGTFSTTGSAWRCDPVGNSAAPGPIVLYTRVRSPRDSTVIHRWYRGNALQKSARLTVRANSTEGYRTYSRQTVHAGDDWRVEVRTPDGDLLYEQRVAVAKAAR